MNHVTGFFQLSATDLSNHLSCAHLTQLNRMVALKELRRPHWNDPSLAVLEQRGRDHEAAYIEHLKRKGLHVVDLRNQSVEATVNAMKRGEDVIVQARLEDGQWMGFADILLKKSGTSKFGDWSYEVQDTKLSQNTRAASILQLCLYTDLLSILQGHVPAHMYIVKPGVDFVTEKYAFAEFKSYYTLVRKNFEAVMAGDALSTFPDPVEHCSVCRWWQVCDKKRHEVDHLSLVAGIRTSHIEELQRQEIQTLEKFANATQLKKPDRGNKETFFRKQLQAKVQFKGRVQKALLFDPLGIEPGRGFNRLPVPNNGDIYFDIEGDPFFEDGGLEYLLGYAYREADALVYKKIWATNRVEERKAFTQFMEAVTERWKLFPNMYIYHFSPYEPSTLKRMARVHALFEKEVDDLLRAERFIDLHTVFKEALLASVESYSLKELEKFTPYLRKVVLHDASVARKAVEVTLELHDFKSLPPETITCVEEYNEDDCLATEALHRWLENLRNTSDLNGALFQRPEVKTGEATENVQMLDTRAQALFKSLTQRLPEDRSTWTGEEKAKWLLAHQIDYFRREDKSAWWEYFRVHELEHDELLDERKAIAGLEFIEVLPMKPRERNQTHRYRYPPQELSVDEGDELVAVKGEKIGSAQAISLEQYIVDIKKTAKAVDIHPAAVHVPDRIDPGTLATSLMDLAAAIDEDGLSRGFGYNASKDLLMRRKPTLNNGTTGAFLADGEDSVDGAIRLASALDRSVLAIQGPPGSGKTYIGAKMIIALAKTGKKIGITAVSHKVIRNLVEKVLELNAGEDEKIKFVHKISEASEQVPNGVTEVNKSDKAIAALQQGAVIGGTAWLWSENDSAGKLDYLFVDEAGQMSLSQVLSASRAAQNLILLGDPQQLEQPQKGSHPEGSDVAALTYLLDGHPTMPEGKGIFLGITRRLHPAVCQFTSEIFYEGRLHSLPGLERQVVGGGTPFDGAGLFYAPVVHRGNQNKSDEEADKIVSIVSTLLLQGTWTNKEGETRPLQKEDILIVAPYNAQVAGLKEKLPAMRIGTVDKFQGQEGAVVIYSMTSSSPEDAPRGMSFLYNPNRLNVASSRAQSVCILVASPRLLEPECHTIDQMRWANALCRFRELASVSP